jgi:hypothetical protein
MIIYFCIFIRIVYDEIVLINGDAESGACSTSSSVTCPAEWIYFENITQISYSAPET